MRATLRLLPEHYDELSSALLEAAPRESVAIGFAGWTMSAPGELILTWRGFQLAGDEDYERRGPGGAVVRPEFLSPAIKRARASNEAVILCHTHPFSSVPSFSGIDDGGEDVLIPKIRDRAPDAPHGGLVLGQAGASVRVWPSGLDHSIEARLVIPGRPGRGRGSNAEFDRQERALGPGSTEALGRLKVGIVGCGGLGWDTATLLWMHGIGGLVLVDHDAIESHNRPRLRGAQGGQIGVSKPAALAQLLRASRLDGEIDVVERKFESPEARQALATVDFIVCATDTLTSRLQVDRFARRLLIPLVDAGINLQVAIDRLERIGGRVCILWPTEACLLCMGIFSPDDVAAEADPLGYRGGARDEEAAVAAFNAVVAGLVVGELLLVALDARSGMARTRYLAFDGLSGRVREIAVPEPGACGTCGNLAGNVFGVLP
ncbi:MAG TPA: ThiF family adenylyltransferase [Galbitalea sp.]|jgi:molybdopterin/thiamine biosynthesis adenylyltransferase